MTVGEKIRKIRKEYRITQRELADMLGTTYQYVSAVERNERNPKTDTIKKFANALGVSPDRLAPQFGNNTGENNMNFGQWMRWQRKSKRMTQEQLANDSGLHVVTIRELEKGKYLPKTETALSLADGLKVPLCDILKHISARVSEELSGSTGFQYNLSNIYYQDYLTWA